MALSSCPSDDGIEMTAVSAVTARNKQPKPVMMATASMKMRAPTAARSRAAATVSFVKGSVSVRTVMKPATTATRSMRINARPTASLRAAGTVSCAQTSQRARLVLSAVMTPTRTTPTRAVTTASLRQGDGMRRLDLQPGEDGAEACDDGNELETDWCLTTCVRPSCGDGFVGPGEGCDDGNDDPADGCHRCQAIPCGDGVLDEGEACDDGNLSNSDQCLNNCVRARCGDGFVGPGEGCDDANRHAIDDCQGCRRVPAVTASFKARGLMTATSATPTRFNNRAGAGR